MESGTREASRVRSQQLARNETAVSGHESAKEQFEKACSGSGGCKLEGEP